MFPLGEMVEIGNSLSVFRAAEILRWSKVVFLGQLTEQAL